MKVPPPAYDPTRITPGVLALGAMTAASLRVMLPFLLSAAWVGDIDRGPRVHEAEEAP
jgi:hypothetical protein